MIERLRRNPLRKAILVSVLPGVAGAVNASSFFSVGHYTSHMTGNVSRIGDELAQGHYGLSFYAITLVLSFLAGASFAALCGELTSGKATSRYALPLCVEAAALLMVISKTASGSLASHPHWVGLICFAMGIQNALVTRISGSVVRTTHLTGVTTDIGIEAVRVAFFLRERLKGKSWRQRIGVLSALHRERELDRLRLFVGIFSSFLSGAIIGPIAYLRYGERSLIIPVLVLCSLAVFDVALGLDPVIKAQDPTPATTR